MFTSLSFRSFGLIFFDRMTWSKEDKVRLVELFFELGSATLARRRFQREGNRRRGPSVKTILRIVRQFRTTGGVVGRTRERGVSPRTPGNVRQIRKAVSRNPRLSVRKLARKTGVALSSVHAILRRWLHLHPYKFQRVHGLRRGDRAARVRLCRWLSPKLGRPQFKKMFFMSDEANFHLDGNVSKQNARFWGSQPPGESVAHDSYSPHLTVWCAVSCATVIGPYFFWEAGHTVTVTSSRYRQMLERFFVPELERRGIPVHSVWFQQDGATAHTAAHVLSYLTEVFGDHIVSKKAPLVWPPRSPDLTYPDFFLWGWLKSEVYRQPPGSLASLKNRIRAAVQRVSPATLAALGDALLARSRECLRVRGGQTEPQIPD